MDVPVLWLAGDERLVGKVGEDEGDGLALRKEGDEILFAPCDNKPMKWVPITDFIVLDPPAEDDGGHAEEPPPPAEEAPPPPEAAAAEAKTPETPFPRRRRG